MQADAAEDDLIAASRRGDRDAFAHIIERYQSAVSAVAYAGLRDRARADDVTQDTFVIAWRRIEELRDGTRLAAWLCGIARNLARDARRRHHREVSGELDTHAHATTPFEELSEAQAEATIAAALGQVPDLYREPLVLYYYEERSIDDVARSLGISTATTNKRLSRGRRFLADRVATVERGLSRYLPRPGLVASVLAVIGIAASASHVDASPAVKGSTMTKLSLAALLTATLGGAGAITIVVATRTDAHAKATPPDDPLAALKLASGISRGNAKPHGHMDHLKLAVQKVPSLLGTGVGTSSASDSNDCVAVGHHLQELEADTTHGDSDRPDDAAAASCANTYQRICETEGWADAQRTCVLAAGDLINAHLCGANVPSDTKKREVPPQLACPTLGKHIAGVMQSAGHHVDVTDLGDQVDSACQVGNWTIEIRQCLGDAASVDALKTCIAPHD